MATRTPHAWRRRLAVRVAAVCVLAGSLGVALALGAASPRPARALARTAYATGSVSIQSSQPGAAILSASDMRPGDSTSGTVTITNAGTAAGDAYLSASGLTDSPGALGGRLSDRLTVTVEDTTTAAAPTTVYSGPMATMPTVALGSFDAGSSRSYRFTATFVPGTGDDAYQGAATSVQYDWSIVAADSAPPPSPSTSTATQPAPAPPAASTPAPPPARIIPPPPVVAPKLLAGAARTQRVLRSGRVRVWTQCDRPCRVRVSLWLRGHRRTPVATASRVIPAGRRVAVTLKLPKIVRFLVRLSHHPVRASVTAAASSVDGAAHGAHPVAVRLRMR